jgi:anti-sigma-K factor RskA
MSSENHIPDDDLVLFALQFLPEERMQEVREHSKNCAVCRTELARLQGDLVAYAVTSEVTAPPAEARERLLKQIAKEPKMAPVLETRAETRAETKPETRAETKPEAKSETRAEARAVDAPARSGEPIFPTRKNRTLPVEIPEEEEETRKRPSRAPWVLAWTGWAVAAGCSFLAGLQLHQRQQVQSSMAAQQARLEQSMKSAAHAQDALATLTAANARQITLHLEPATLTKKPGSPAVAAPATPEALAAYIADKGALVFVATHLLPIAGDKTYELWLLPASGATPIPAGTFKPDAQGSASLVMPHLPRGMAAKGFGVTVENAGGSSTPTLPIMMSGS